MRELNGNNFGIVIAYLIPGFVVLVGLSFHSATVREWLSAGGSAATVGGFLYTTIASLSAGLTVSTVRWAVIDRIHHATGIPGADWDDDKLNAQFTAFQYLVENHYRYYQFYSGMQLAVLLLWLSFELSRAGIQWAAFVATIFLEITFWLGSRDALAKYHRRSNRLLGRTRRRRSA